MPALRIEGIYPFASTSCVLTMETGEIVGDISATTIWERGLVVIAQNKEQ